MIQVFACVAASAVLAGAAAVAQPAIAQPAPAPVAAETRILADLPLSGLESWSRARRALERVGGGVAVAVEAVSINGAIISLRASGDRAGVEAALRAAGLELVAGANGRASLRVTGG